MALTGCAVPNYYTKATALGAALWNGYPLTLSGILDLAIERSRLATTAGDGG